MEFSRQEHWSRLPFPSPEDLPDPGIEPGSPSFQADSFPFEPQGNCQKGKAQAKYTQAMNMVQLNKNKQKRDEVIPIQVIFSAHLAAYLISLICSYAK